MRWIHRGSTQTTFFATKYNGFASSAAASCLANVGPAFGRVGSDDHYSWLTPASKSVLIALMLLGRLELFVVIALFTRRFWNRG